MAWVSRITVIALEMVLPGIAGQKLDERLGTGYWGLLGFALGMTAAIYHLVAITRVPPKK